MTRTLSHTSHTSHTPHSGTPDFAVPVVDIGAYVAAGSAAQRAAVVSAVDQACTEVGFIQVLGHGIPAETVAGLADAIDRFFGQSLTEKRRWVRPPAENRGYSPPKSESLSLSLGVEAATRMNDFFEAYNVGSQAPDHAADHAADQAADLAAGSGLGEHYADNTWPELAGFEAQVDAWRREAARVARTMTTIFAAALGLPSDHFERLATHPIEVLRMNNYALPDGTDVTLDGELTGMGEHTDYGFVTILWADQAPGLQVLGRDGVWHDVQPLPGALLINLGDLMARLTNERWTSTLHRVKPPVVDGTIQRRRSAAFFHDGDAEAVVGPLPSCVDQARPALYTPVTIDEHIRAKLAGSRVGVVNTAAEREGARVLASQRT